MIFVARSEKDEVIGYIQWIQKSGFRLNECNSNLKAILVSTRVDNKAQELYKKALGAEVISVIKDLYSHDEVILMAKGI
jgi:hypothetical protein